jgi:hypothetical protein
MSEIINAKEEVRSYLKETRKHVPRFEIHERADEVKT